MRTQPLFKDIVLLPEKETRPLISNARLKPYLLNNDYHIREFVAKYFAESYSNDPELMDFALKACDRHGEESNQLLISYASYFPLSEQNFLNVIDRMSATGNLQSLSSWGRILAEARAEWLEKYREEIIEKCKFGKNVATKIDWRLTISRYSPTQAWEAVREYNEECNKKNLTINEVDSAYVDSLLDLLSKTNTPPDEAICEALSDERLKGELLEFWMIELAGLRKTPQAMPLLVKKLQIDTDYLRQKAIDAIVRIGDPRAIDLIDKTYADDRWDVRLCSLNVPARIKCTRSEEFFLHHLKHEKDVSIRTYLCGGLCGLFSQRGVDVVREEIHNGYDHGALPLPYLLTDMTEILSIPLPNCFLWKMERDYNENRPTHKRNTKGKKPRQEKEIRENIKTNEYELPEDKPEPARRKKPKVGRNDPCPCGSGRKYKKCCNSPK